jgi:hypothetical protein
MMHLDSFTLTASVVILALALLFPLLIIVKNYGRRNDLVGQKPGWKFSEWAGALTSTGAVAGLLLPILDKDLFGNGLSVVLGAASLLLPVGYATVWTGRRGPVWFFLVWSTLLQVVVVVQLLIAASLADDSAAIALPTSTLHILRICATIGALMCVLYTWRSTQEIVEHQTVQVAREVKTLTSGSEQRA